MTVEVLSATLEGLKDEMPILYTAVWRREAAFCGKDSAKKLQPHTKTSHILRTEKLFSGLMFFW